MIELMLRLGNEIVLVRIQGNRVEFGNTAQGAMMSSIGGMRLSKVGVLKEFPDLEEDVDWRIKAVNRFIEKIRSFESEEAIASYIITDLKKFGYFPMYRQKAGMRREDIRDGLA